eukprot:4157378-Prymnesium_polylepis.1
MLPSAPMTAHLGPRAGDGQHRAALSRWLRVQRVAVGNVHSLLQGHLQGGHRLRGLAVRDVPGRHVHGDDRLRLDRAVHAATERGDGLHHRPRRRVRCLARRARRGARRELRCVGPLPPQRARSQERAAAFL